MYESTYLKPIIKYQQHLFIYVHHNHHWLPCLVLSTSSLCLQISYKSGDIKNSWQSEGFLRHFLVKCFHLRLLPVIFPRGGDQGWLSSWDPSTKIFRKNKIADTDEIVWKWEKRFPLSECWDADWIVKGGGNRYRVSQKNVLNDNNSLKNGTMNKSRVSFRTVRMMGTEIFHEKIRVMSI